MGLTVTQIAYAYGGSNPSLPTSPEFEEQGFQQGLKTKGIIYRGSSSVDRALAFQAEGRGFEPRLPLSMKRCLLWMAFFFTGSP